jgi:hypothetical protein
LAFCKKTGLPPTLLNALTGEFTPPGMLACALVKSCSLLEMFIVVDWVAAKVNGDRRKHPAGEEKSG